MSESTVIINSPICLAGEHRKSKNPTDTQLRCNIKDAERSLRDLRTVKELSENNGSVHSERRYAVNSLLTA